MSPENFAYWLKGAIELGNFSTFDDHQVQIIQDHLDLVFKKETPIRQISTGPNNLPFGPFPSTPLITC